MLPLFWIETPVIARTATNRVKILRTKTTPTIRWRVSLIDAALCLIKLRFEHIQTFFDGNILLPFQDVFLYHHSSYSSPSSPLTSESCISFAAILSIIVFVYSFLFSFLSAKALAISATPSAVSPNTVSRFF